MNSATTPSQLSRQNLIYVVLSINLSGSLNDMLPKMVMIGKLLLIFGAKTYDLTTTTTAMILTNAGAPHHTQTS